MPDKCLKGTEGCRYANDPHGNGMPCETGDAFRERMRLRDLATEERLAWDRYAAGATMAGVVNGITPSLAAKWADQLLDERRKRFGGSK
jgi:hypothetical protein